MVTVLWSQLRDQIARKLADPNMRTYSADLIRDAVNDALRALASTHTGVASTHDIVGDGQTYQFALPDNIVDTEDAGVYAVEWPGQQWLRRLEYWPGTAWPSAERSTSSRPVGYILWPQGYVSFSRVPDNGATVRLHYVAYYDEVVDDDSMVTVPRWALEAVKLYAAACALEPSSAKAAHLGQYKSRMESGDPEDNPVLQLALHYMRRYQEILAQHPAPQYAKLAPPED